MVRIGKTVFALLAILVMVEGGLAQDSEEKKKFFDNWEIKPVVGAQFWSTYTTNAELFDRDSLRYIGVDGRLNFSLRRTRLGARIKAGENVTLVLVTAIDNVGRDILSGQTGGANNGAIPQVGVWNAFVNWRLKQGSEAFNLVIGYHVPHFSRESPTVWHAVSSFDKSQSQGYIRRHLTGKNPGRSMGLTLGGLLLENNDKLQLQYSLGVFNSIFGQAIGNSAGIKSSPLLTGRIMLAIGQPEKSIYSTFHRFNYLSKRNGLSLAISGSYEGQNELFTESYAFSFDALYNYGNLNLGGEIGLLYRSGQRVMVNQELRQFTTNAIVSSVSVSYNFQLPKGHLLEPSVTYMKFSGPSLLEEIRDALAVSASAGSNSYVDMGVSYHIIPGKLRIDLHYVSQSGNQVDSTPGDSINDFFFQSGFAIRRGDYIGAGVLFVL